MYKITFLILAGLLASCFALPSQAAECAVTIEANDAMKYNTDSIKIPSSCDQFEVTLKHVGKLDAQVMGHNVVISRTSDITALAQAAMQAGAAQQYVPADDSRILAHSELIGGGQSTTFTIPVASLPTSDDLSFFCSFPGHYALMQGKVVLVP